MREKNSIEIHLLPNSLSFSSFNQLEPQPRLKVSKKIKAPKSVPQSFFTSATKFQLLYEPPSPSHPSKDRHSPTSSSPTPTPCYPSFLAPAQCRNTSPLLRLSKSLCPSCNSSRCSLLDSRLFDQFQLQLRSQ